MYNQLTVIILMKGVIIMSERSDIQIADLKNWKTEVHQELSEVNEVLNNVAKISQECSGDEDVIYTQIGKLGEGIAESYMDLSNAFEKVMEATEKIISSFSKFIENVGEAIGNVVDRWTN